MHKPILGVLIVLALAGGCEEKATPRKRAPAPPTASSVSATPTPSAPPAITPAAPISLATPAAAQGDIAVGDPIRRVFDVWGKPEVFKLSIYGDAVLEGFSSMPEGINPDAQLTFYFVSRAKAVVFRFGDNTELVEAITPIPESERDMVETAARREAAPKSLPVPSLPPTGEPAPAPAPAPSPGGGP